MGRVERALKQDVANVHGTILCAAGSAGYFDSLHGYWGLRDYELSSILWLVNQFESIGKSPGRVKVAFGSCPELSSSPYFKRNAPYVSPFSFPVGESVRCLDDLAGLSSLDFEGETHDHVLCLRIFSLHIMPVGPPIELYVAAFCTLHSRSLCSAIRR